jgi:hypothetical protein
MARPMTPEAVALRGEVMEAVRGELAQGRSVDRHAVVREFQGRVATTTALRWVEQAVAGFHNPSLGSGSTEDQGQPVMEVQDGGASAETVEGYGSPETELPGHAEAPAGVMVAAETTPTEPTPSPVDQPSGVVVAFSPAELRRIDGWRRCQFDSPDRSRAIQILVRAQLGMPD